VVNTLSHYKMLRGGGTNKGEFEAKKNRVDPKMGEIEQRGPCLPGRPKGKNKFIMSDNARVMKRGKGPMEGGKIHGLESKKRGGTFPGGGLIKNGNGVTLENGQSTAIAQE